MPVEQSFIPSPSALRRALRRADDAVTLDRTEAETLLHAAWRRPRPAAHGRGPGARRRSGARRPPRGGHLLAQGLHPADPAVPRPLPLLHVRPDADPARARGPAPYLSPDEVLAIAGRGRCDGLQGGAVHPRRPAGGPLAGRARVARRARLRLDAGLPARHGDPRPGGDRPAAAPQPRRDVVGGDPAAQAGRAVDGHDARDHEQPAVDHAGRGAPRLPGQGPGCAAAGAGGRRPLRPSRSPPACCSASARPTPSGSTRCSRSAPRDRRHGHVQETIVQNFRAKDRTAMRTTDDLATEEYAAAVAVTRLVLGPRARLQAPPNLTDPAELGLLVRAGIDDWGGVSPLTPDHVNPERPWPHVEDLARLTAEAGFTLRERLTAHPHYVRAGEPWIDPRVLPHVRALADDDGLAVEGRAPGRAAVAGARPAVGLVGPGRPARRDRHLGRTATAAATSTRSTATGRRSARRRSAPSRLGQPRPSRSPPAPTPRSAPRCCGQRTTPPGSPTPSTWPCSAPRAPTSRPSRRSPTGSVRTSTATSCPTSSTGTSTSPTSATPAAGSAPSPSAAPTPTRSRCRSRRSATASTRRGRSARPRSACRAASTRTCRAPRTSTSPAR